ncbi:MAG: helix-turn-helix domain-containing protein [Flavobacteriales bacterium]|nr:helix-turn-helix domain-containing protein [Flavobacteriales bacterium]
MVREYRHPITGGIVGISSIDNFRSKPETFVSDLYSLLWIYEGSGSLDIDEAEIELQGNQILFIGPNQKTQFSPTATAKGTVINFNRDFYCIEIHDQELSCNGFLFNNIFQNLSLTLSNKQVRYFNSTVRQMQQEMDDRNISKDEMLRILLKILLIQSNRLLRAQTNFEEHEEEFMREFSQLVEKHYKKIKSVNEYAKMLGMASASLTKKLNLLGKPTPSSIITERSLLEAKRAILYTNKSIKEIAFDLGYEDPYYLSRIFKQKTGFSPTEYKTKSQKRA